jgi:hypothetical protein
LKQGSHHEAVGLLCVSQEEAHYKQAMCHQEEENIMKKMCITRNNMSLGKGEFVSPRRIRT